MAVLWHLSLVPWILPDGSPDAGAEAYFFDAGTTTPQIVYTDSSLSIPHDHPVTADGSGKFPAIFFADESIYKLRIEHSDATVDETDNIAVPTTTPPEFPDSETEPQYLFNTGDIKMRWSVTAPTGWVRANGRTLGSASSGATERANADTEALFLLLWEDTNLAVSGGRGGTAVGDWTANKAIAVPDFRGRVPVGPDSFGNSAAGRITDAVLGADSDTLGLAGGAQTHTLTEAELAEHTHTGTTDSGGSHTHAFSSNIRVGSINFPGAGGVNFFINDANPTALSIESGGAHTHTFTPSTTGDGDPHNNLQPSYVVPYFIKL